MTFSLSVIVPNLNDARHLPGALDALLSQDQPAKEIFVVDDCSDDDSRRVIEDYARRCPAIHPVFRTRTMGVVAAMNEFARKATGEYLYFAAADDRVLPGFFAAVRDQFETHPGAGLCSSLCRATDEDGKDLGVIHSPRPSRTESIYISPGEGRRLLLGHDSWVIGNTAVYRREAVLAEGGFVPELHGFSDGFMHRLMILKHGACFMPKVFACMRQREGSISNRTNTDPAILADVLNRASILMREDPDRRFSPAYIERWRRRTRFGAMRLQLAGAAPTFRAMRQQGLSAADALLVRALTAARLRRLAGVSLFARMRPFDILPMVQHRMGFWKSRTQNKAEPVGVRAQGPGFGKSERSA